jgi:hypothetical protein
MGQGRAGTRFVRLMRETAMRERAAAARPGPAARGGAGALVRAGADRAVDATAHGRIAALAAFGAVCTSTPSPVPVQAGWRRAVRRAGTASWSTQRRDNCRSRPALRRVLPEPTSHPLPIVLDKLFGGALHQHPEAAQRVLGIAQLPPDAKAIVQLLTTDPAAEVRAAAAARCGDGAALETALQAETDAAARAAIGAALGRWLAAQSDSAPLTRVLAAPYCTDDVRAAVAQHATAAERQRLALERIVDEDVLVDLALAATHAPQRLAAAERVRSPQALRRLFDGAKDKDRGVARLARQRLDEIAQRAKDAALADDLLAQAAALVAQPGPIVMAAVELDRRWRTLQLGDDADRHARWEAIGRQMQQRFAQERAAQQAHARLDQRIDAWLAALRSPESSVALPMLRSDLDALRAEAVQAEDAAALARLADGEPHLARWEALAPALAAAEALVDEAEALAAGTSIDDAQLPARWHAMDAAARPAALAQRFDAAIRTVEQRRTAHARAEQDAQGGARNRLHAALHAAEQALVAGQLHEARVAADEARALKPAAGLLPKPTVQRLSRVVQQLGDLERWEKFGQQSAREQLCERAEALAQQAPAPAALAREVQQLRAEWKALDAQHAGVPKALWERFDGACEKAYAPAARHFAELAAQHKAARQARDEFIAAAAAQAQALLAAEPRDWRAVEHALRQTDATWRGPALGSVEPAAWKKLDSKLKAALAPLREALGETRRQAKAAREALIAEAEGWVPRAQEREAPNAVRDLQARWQAAAKSVALLQRDERALWEKFRSACNAVFDARKNVRSEADERRHAQRRALETLCEQAEHIAQATDLDEAQARERLRTLRQQWTEAQAAAGAAPAAFESRFRAARGALDESLKRRVQAREAAVWRALLERTWLCDELDALVAGEQSPADLAAPLAALQARWDALPEAGDAWAQKLAARRQAALDALADDDARWDHRDRIEGAAAARAEGLLELELQVDLPSPAELQAERMAVRVRRLRDRFKREAAGGADSAEQMLLAWCALPGSSEARDRQRIEKIVGAIERRR